MTVQRFFLALALATGLPVAATAQPCFDAAGLVPYGCPTAVNYLYRPQSNGQVILNDEKGKPLYRAVVVPGAKKKDLPLVGIADMSGREIVPPRFERVYAVGRNLAVGEAPLNPKDTAESQRAFLIDLRTGEYRPTPWRRIITTLTYNADGPPWLMGVLPHTRTHPYDVAILTPIGTDTSLRVDNFNPFSGGTKVLTVPYNLLEIGGAIVNERGEDPFAGMEMVKVASGFGYFVKRGPPPAEVKGPGAGPLLTPIGSDLRPQTHPADVIGMVQAGSWMWIIRRTPKGVRFYQHVGGKPILAAPPVGEAYLDLYVDKDGDVAVRTAAGWIDPFHRKPFPTAEAVLAARKAETREFVAAVRAEENARFAAQARAEVDAKAAQAAAAQAYREQVRGRIREAKAGRLATAICARVEGQTDTYPLLARLQTRLQGLWSSRFNDRQRQYAERTAGAPLTTRDLWSHDGGMPIGDGWAHQAAATLWPEGYMALLIGFPSLFQSGFAEPLEPLDADRVAALVSACPPIFSDNGAPLGPVVPFVLLEAIEGRLPSMAMEDMLSAEAGVVRLLEAVMSRPDGHWLGRAWLQQIIWRGTSRRAGRGQADVDAQRAIRDRLLATLSTHVEPLGAAAFGWIRAEEPLWVVHRILAEASILEAHGDAVSAAEILASGVRQGLVTATGRADGMTTRSPESDVVARVLTGIPDLAQWFETLWRETYEVREALSYPVQRNLDNPAYPSLAWSLNGLNSSQQAPVDQAALWRAIADAVFETQRIDPNASLFNGAMPPITRVTCQLGAALAEQGIVPVDDLACFLGDQLDPTAEHVRLWQIVRAEASDALALEAGRKVGAALVCEAIETALSEPQPNWDIALDATAKADLMDFARRL